MNTTEIDGSERRRALRRHYAVIDQRPFCFIADDPPSSLIERYPNGGVLQSIYLANHECDGSIDADVWIELWAYTDADPDWFVSWKFNTPLQCKPWPLSIEFCPFCGIDLRAFYSDPHGDCSC